MTNALDKARSATMSSLQDTRTGYMKVRDEVRVAYPLLITDDGRRLMQRFSQQLAEATDIIAKALRLANKAESQEALDFANAVATKMNAELISMCVEFTMIITVDDPRVLMSTGGEE